MGSWTISGCKHGHVVDAIWSKLESCSLCHLHGRPVISPRPSLAFSLPTLSSGCHTCAFAVRSTTSRRSASEIDAVRRSNSWRARRACPAIIRSFPQPPCSLCSALVIVRILIDQSIAIQPTSHVFGVRMTCLCFTLRRSFAGSDGRWRSRVLLISLMAGLSLTRGRAGWRCRWQLLVDRPRASSFFFCVCCLFVALVFVPLAHVPVRRRTSLSVCTGAILAVCSHFLVAAKRRHAVMEAARRTTAEGSDGPARSLADAQRDEGGRGIETVGQRSRSRRSHSGSDHCSPAPIRPSLTAVSLLAAQ